MRQPGSLESLPLRVLEPCSHSSSLPFQAGISCPSPAEGGREDGSQGSF